MGYKAATRGTTTTGTGNIITLFFNNPYFQFGFAIAEFALNKKKSSKARKRAKEQQAEANALKIDAVSYTHLTLPTILRV